MPIKRVAKLLLLGLMAVSATGARASALRILCRDSDRTLTVVGSDGEHILARSSSATAPVSAGSYQIEGSLRGDFRQFVWLADTHFARANVPDRQSDSGKVIEAIVTIRHGVSMNTEGVLDDGMLVKLWPELACRPGALVFVWLVGDQVAQVDVRPVHAAEAYLDFDISSHQRFTPVSAAQCRVGVAAVQDGRILTPTGLGSGLEDPVAIEACVFDDVSLLDRSPGAYGQTPDRVGREEALVRFAAQSGAARVVEYLIRSEPALRDRASVRGETLLHLAARSGRLAVVDCLLRAGAAANPHMGMDRTTPLVLAAAAGHSGVVTRLLAAKVPTGEISRVVPSGPLEAALMCGDAESCEALRRAGASWPEDGRTAMRLVDAARAGWTATVRWLLANASKDSVELGRDLALAELADGSADRMIGELLLDAGASPTVILEPVSKRIPVLTAACRRGGFGLAEALIAHGVAVDSTDGDGNTALHFMAIWNRPEAIQFLLAHGANSARRNRAKTTPLELALLNDAAPAARALAEAGTEIDLSSPKAADLLGIAIRLDLAQLIDAAQRHGWNGTISIGGETWSAAALAKAFGASEVAKALAKSAGVTAPADYAVVGPKVTARNLKLVRATAIPFPATIEQSGRPVTVRIEAILDREGKVVLAGLRERPDAGNIAQLLREVSAWRFSPVVADDGAKAARISFPVRINPNQPRTFYLSEVDSFPRLLPASTVKIPPVGRNDLQSGLHWLSFTVQSNGIVAEAKLMPEGRTDGAAEAIRAVSQWRFEPALIDRQPVAVQIYMPLHANDSTDG